MKSFACLSVLLLHVATSVWGESPEPAGSGFARSTAPTVTEFVVETQDILETKVHEVGGRTVTIQRIKPVKLPDPPPPLPPADVTDPAVLQRIAEMRAKYRKTEFAFVSATVYDRSRTFVRWWPSGRVGQEIAGWTNVDFNYLIGLAKVAHGERDFSLMMTIGNMDTVRLATRLQRRGFTYRPPVPPEFQDDAPAFIVTKGDTSVPGAMDLMEGLLSFYEENSASLVERTAQREAAQIAAAAELKANPPVPQDIVLSHWRTGGKAVKPQTEEAR